MSFTIRPLDLKDPNQDSGFSGRGGGEIKAISSPCRVTKIGRPVLFTLSSRAKHTVLNFVTGTISSA